MLGAFLWIAFKLQWIEIYPAANHANLMIGGFLFSYAIGFLWTAVPRFLQAPAPAPRELLIVATAMAVSPVLGLLSEPTYFYVALLVALFATVRFGRKRFKLRKSDPPSSFLFVLAGVLLVIVSLFTLLLSQHLELPQIMVAVARTFFYKGFVLCLVLGIGIKLLPALLGWTPPPNPQANGEPFRLDLLLFPLLFLLLGGIILEAIGMISVAGLAYTGALTGAAFLRMRLGRVPKTRSPLAFSLWTSGLTIAFSPLALVYDPSFSVHFWHLVFISGFGLMTIFVSMRVLLAHSGQEFLYWEKKPVLYLLAGLVLLSALTRVTAPLLAPEHLLSHYAYAAGTWIAALGIWLFYFLRFTLAHRL